MPNNFSKSSSKGDSSKEVILASLSKKQLEDYCSFFDKSNLDELLLEEGGVKLVLRKRKPQTPGGVVLAQPPPTANQEYQVDTTAQPAKVQKEEIKEEAPKKSKHKEVVSPITGTFYQASSPDALPFVKVGDKVNKGQPLCIIEAMKIMNEIEAPFGGTVLEILAENNQQVQQNQVLFVIS